MAKKKSAKQAAKKQTGKSAAATAAKTNPTSAKSAAALITSASSSASAVASAISAANPNAPYKPLTYKTTEDIPVSTELIDNIIGQEQAVHIIKKAAQQRRHVLLVGEPGTGKSMLGLALAQLLPKEKLVDILSFQNPNDENQPLIRVMPSGEGRRLVNRIRGESQATNRTQTFLFIIFLFIALIIPYYLWKTHQLSDIVYSASIISGLILAVGFFIVLSMNRRAGQFQKISIPKVIVDTADKKQAPFNDATGSHAGALLGDVLHDPFQSGGLGTPAHERVVAGMIHNSNLGVLFIDEVATLQVNTQQELLTAIQEGKFSITGQSERSAGAMVHTEPVPCNFILVAAGNYDSMEHMHPALRSRIRGYGYEVYMKDVMPDTQANRDKLVRFVAQEIAKDKKIPHFSKGAVDIIIQEARRRANRKGHLTLRLRELGGIIRAAGDYALEVGAKLVEAKHVQKTKLVARSLEHQMADRIIEHRRDYEILTTTGTKIGHVNGLSVMGDGSSYSGNVLPIEAEVVSTGRDSSGVFVATGGLGDIAKESITNVSALVKKLFNKDLQKSAVYVQFVQTHGVEGDSASIAIATAVISAVTQIPVRQDTAMTGSVSVRGTVLPIGGATYKLEAAIEAGIKQVLVPESNVKDIVLADDQRAKIKIIPVSSMIQVLEHSLDWKGHEHILKKLQKAE